MIVYLDFTEVGTVGFRIKRNGNCVDPTGFPSLAYEYTCKPYLVSVTDSVLKPVMSFNNVFRFCAVYIALEEKMNIPFIRGSFFHDGKRVINHLPLAVFSPVITRFTAESIAEPE